MEFFEFKVEDASVKGISELLESLLIVGKINEDTEIFYETLARSGEEMYFPCQTIETDLDNDIIMSYIEDDDVQNGVKVNVFINAISKIKHTEKTRLWFHGLDNEAFLVDKYAAIVDDEDNMIVFISEEDKDA